MGSEIEASAIVVDELPRQLRLVRRPVVDAARYDRVWTRRILPLNGACAMSPQVRSPDVGA